MATSYGTGYSTGFGSSSSVLTSARNSVDTHRTIRTILPSNVSLTIDEKAELLRMEKNPNTTDSFLIREFNLANTENVGIHYHCIEKKKGLAVLATNPNISFEIVFLLIRIATTPPTSGLTVEHQAGLAIRLLSNQAVVTNVALYDHLFSKTIELGLWKPEALFESALQFLNKFIASKNNLPLFVCLIEKHGMFDGPHKKQYYNTAFLYQKDIKEYWASHEDAERNVYSGLPFEWAMGMIGYSEEI